MPKYQNMHINIHEEVQCIKTTMHKDLKHIHICNYAHVALWKAVHADMHNYAAMPNYKLQVLQ